MSVGKPSGPQWWSRPDAVPEAQVPVLPAPPVLPVLPVLPGPPVPPVPRHAPDPYDTPPYGDPGPWAPAPLFEAPLVAPLVEAPLVRAPLSIGHWHLPAATAPAPPRTAPERRRGRLGPGLVVAALMAGALGGAAGAYLKARGGPDRSVSLPQVVASATASAGVPDRTAGSVAAIAARTLPGVVYIHVRSGSGEGTGTGFVLDGQGHILTNSHVVETAADGGTISVTFSDGRVASNAEIVGRDSGYDLAVIKVPGPGGLHPLTFGDSDSVQVGDPVVAIGAPYDLEGTVTSGIISATHRPITAGGGTDGTGSGGTDVSYVDALQTDAPINPGNSGGPLVDADGLVIGINSAIRSAGGSTESTDQGGSIGLGFAIPANQAKLVAEELISTGKATHPVIGVGINTQYQGDGAQVSDQVTPGGPGDRAGLRTGDVITAIDGEAIHSGQELIVRIRGHRPGDQLTLAVLRGGTQRNVQLTLGSATGD